MKLAITTTLSLFAATVVAQDGFICPEGSEFANLEDAIGLSYCLDSDPVPSALFEPSELNFFLNSANPDLAINGVYYLDVGGGHIVFGGAGSYLNSLYIYKLGCKSSKSGKGGSDDDDDDDDDSPSKSKKGKGSDDDYDDDEDDGRRKRKLRNKAIKGARSRSSANKRSKTRRVLKGKKGNNDLCDVAQYGAIILDAPPSFGPTFGDNIASYLEGRDAVLTTMIVTHTHYDHIGGWSNLFSSNPYLEYYIASEQIAEALEFLQDTVYDNEAVNEVFSSNPDGPDMDINIVIEGWEELEIGNQTMEFRPMEGHQAGNLLVYHEASKTLSFIDSMVFPKWSPFFDVALATDGPASFKNFDVFRQYDYDYFMAGHVTHLGTREDVEISEKYMTDILRAAYDALLATNPFDSFGAAGVFTPGDGDFGNLFLGFNDYLNTIAHACAAIVLDPTKNYSGYEWISVLGAVRVTLYSHCSAIGNFLRLDNPGI